MSGIIIKSPNLDEVWEMWKRKNLNNSKFRKIYEVKGARFSPDKISAAEYVKNVEKGALLFVQIRKQISPAKGKSEKYRKNAKELRKITFFDFGTKRVDKSEWKYDEMVPFLSTLEQNACSRCSGTGGVKCSKCGGTGQKKCPDCENGYQICKKCNGKGKIEIEISVIDEAGNKKKIKKKVVCDSCFGKGKLVCKTCGGTNKVYCSTCGGSGKLECDTCAGFGYIFTYEVKAVPFKSVDESNHVLLSSFKMDKNIYKKMGTDIENVIRNIGYIALKDLKDFNKKFVNANLGYLDKDIWKIVKEGKDKIEKSQKDKDVKVSWPVYLIPMMVLECTSPKKKSYEIYVIGTDKRFEIYGEL